MASINGAYGDITINNNITGASDLEGVLNQGNTMAVGQFIDATAVGAGTAIDATGSDIIAQNLEVEKIIPLGSPIITDVSIDGGLKILTGGNYHIDFEDGIQIKDNNNAFIYSDGTNLFLSPSGYVSATCVDTYVNTLHYTTLDPPVSGTTPNISAVLTAGNDAGNQDITNVKDITCNTLNYTTLSPAISQVGITYQTTYANLGTDILQTQINTLAGATRKQLIISPGAWTPTGAITFNNLDTCFVSGAGGDTSITRITPSSGGLTITGASSTRNQFRDLDFGDLFTINGTQGRHTWTNCNFLGGLLITGTTTNFLVFDNCDFTGGAITIPITFGAVAYFKNCNFAGTTAFNFNQPMATQLIMFGCLGLNPVNPAKITELAFNEINGLTQADASIVNCSTLNSTADINGLNGTFTDGTTTILIDTGTVKGIEIQNGIGQAKIKLVDTDGDEIEIQNTEIDIFHSGATNQTNRYFQFKDNNANQVDWYMGSSVPSHPATNGSIFVLTGVSPNIYQRGPAGWTSIVPTSPVPSQRVLSIGKNVDLTNIFAGAPYQIQWNTQQFEQNSLGYFRWPNPNSPRAGASTILVEKTGTYFLNASLAIQYPTSLPGNASFELYIRIYDSGNNLVDNLIDGTDLVPQPSGSSRTLFTLQVSKYKQLNINDRVEVWIANNTANTSTVFGTSLYADQTYLQISIVD